MFTSLENSPQILSITLQFDKVDRFICQRYSNRFCFVAVAFINQTETINKVFNNCLGSVYVSPFNQEVTFYFLDNSFVIYELSEELVKIAKTYDLYGADVTLIRELVSNSYNLVKSEN